MGRAFLVGRLAARNMRRRWNEALLLLLAITAASGILTLGLALRNVSNQPFQQTKTATKGPDLIAESSYDSTGVTTPADLAALIALQHAPGVKATSGPFPLTTAVVRTGSLTAGADIEGRPSGMAAVDTPKVTDGTWVQPGGVVVERVFAAAASLKLGQPITLNGHPFKVVGFAITTAFSPYPQLGCLAGCSFGSIHLDATDTGLMWTTEAAARGLVTKAAPLTYYSNLTVADPTLAYVNQFENRYGNGYDGNGTPSAMPFVNSWREVSREDNDLIRNEQIVLLVGSWLLAILAVASVAVLVGGRMADQMRRVGLLKAIGGTPGLVAAVLMAEYVAIALLGALLGMVAGWLFAPVLTKPGDGLIGAAPSTPLTMSIALIVIAVALGVAVIASLVPALRAARTSTVRALADSARAPRRSRLLIAFSTRLPVSLMIAFRIMARRLRRTALATLSIFVTVSGMVAVIIAHGSLTNAQSANAFGFAGTAGLINPRNQGADQVLLIVTAMLVALAAVNAIFITRAIVQDARHASAVTRALGATPLQVTAGLAGAQTVPAVLGALLGLPGGFLLYDIAKHNGAPATLPPLVDLAAVVIGAALVIALLTSIPARWGTRRSVATILQSEMA